MKAMLLTAGLGTRLRPVTNAFAKPAVPFLGVPLAFYPAHLLREAGVTDLTLNAHHKPEQISKLAEALSRQGFKTHISFEPDAPLGSGGGIWKAKSFLNGNGNFFVCNGDEVILPRKKGVLKRLLEHHTRTQALCTISVMRHPLVGTQFGGVWCDERGAVLGFGKDRTKFPQAKDGFHYIGVLLLNQEIFSYLPEGESNILYDALAAAIAKGERVDAVVEDQTWFETGNPQDFLHATKEALELLAQYGDDSATLKAILQTSGGAEFSLENRNNVLVYKHRSAQIAQDAQLKGFVVCESGSAIASHARVENCVLMPAAQIPSGQQVSNEIVFDS